jgi:signal peptidase I
VSIQPEKFLIRPEFMADPLPLRSALHLELAEEALLQFSQVRFVARGTSMLPAIYPGDCLTVMSCETGVPENGDIVLASRGGQFRVHRIVQVRKDGVETSFVLRGDALKEEDPAIQLHEILGRVCTIERDGKSIAVRSVQPAYLRVLGFLVRHSRIAAALSLRLHSMRVGRPFSACTGVPGSRGRSAGYPQ